MFVGDSGIAVDIAAVGACDLEPFERELRASPSRVNDRLSRLRLFPEMRHADISLPKKQIRASMRFCQRHVGKS
jgi:hypothetical protein